MIENFNIKDTFNKFSIENGSLEIVFNKSGLIKGNSCVDCIAFSPFNNEVRIFSSNGGFEVSFFMENVKDIFNSKEDLKAYFDKNTNFLKTAKTSSSENNTSAETFNYNEMKALVELHSGKTLV